MLAVFTLVVTLLDQASDVHRALSKTFTLVVYCGRSVEDLQYD